MNTTAPSDPTLWGRLVAYGFRVVQTAAILCSVATLASFAAPWWWPCELACHFVVQYLVTLVVAAIVYAAGRCWLRFSVVCALAAVNFAGVLPLWLGGPSHATVEPSVRLLVLNVLTENDDHQAVLDLIEQTQPDVIVLPEFGHSWRQGLASLDTMYPHARKIPRVDNFGLAIYCRVPGHREQSDSNVQFVDLEDMPIDGDLPMIALHLKQDDVPLTIVGAHVVPPVGSRGASARNRQLAEIAHRVQSLPGEVVVAGDLNVTRWSPFFANLLHTGQLRDSSLGYGLQTTWPSGMPLLRIPIDHVLASEGVIVVDRQVIPVAGSDHDAIVVDLSVSVDASLPAHP